MKKFIFGLICLLLFILPSSTNAVSRRYSLNVVGIIDMAVVRTLHPMQQYYLEEANIYLNPMLNTPPENIALEAEKRDAAAGASILLAEEEIRKLHRRINLINRHVSTINEEGENRKKLLKQKYSTIYGQADSPIRNRHLEEVRREMRLMDEQVGYRKTTMESELQQADNSLRRARERVFAINYLSQVETTKLENTMKEDIQKAIDTVIQKRGIQIVVDPSVLQPTKSRNWGEIITKFWKTPGSQWSNFYFISQENMDFAMEDVPADILKDYQYRVREKLRDLDENSFPRLENYILSGGVDLTADVVREVLKQYDYSIKRYQAVEETVKEYRLQRRAK